MNGDPSRDALVLPDVAWDSGQRRVALRPFRPGRHRRVASRRALDAVVCATVALAALPRPARAQDMPTALLQFLRKSIGLDAGDLERVARGAAVVQTLHPADPSEVAVFGIIRIAVPRSFYLARASDLPSALHTPSRLEVGVFSDPAVPSDVAAFSLPHDDVRDLAQCRPGSCKLKLPETSIEDLRALVASNAPSADSIASAYVRRRMVDYVTRYRARGNAAMVTYDDAQGAPARQIFQGILARSPYMYQYVPSLERYLENYPNDRPPNIKEVIFWSLDDFGLKPTLTLTHEVAYSPPELPGSTLIASKQLFADHYLDGALSLLGVADASGDSTAAAPGIYVVLLRRMHFDHLPGGLLDIRGRVRGKVHDRTQTFLRDTKRSSERAYAAR
jgi:hypothetical protein